MKKLIAIAATGVMMLGLTACAQDIAYDVNIDDLIEDEDFDEEYDSEIQGGLEDNADATYEESQGVPDDVEFVPDQDYEGYEEVEPPYPLEEFGTDPEDMQWFVGYWEGAMTPPVVWYLFTSDGQFYCNRDKGYLEKGTYIAHAAGHAWLTYDSGENEDLFNFDPDYITYPDTDGLYRTKTDDTVEQWILDEFK